MLPAPFTGSDKSAVQLLQKRENSGRNHCDSGAAVFAEPFEVHGTRGGAHDGGRYNHLYAVAWMQQPSSEGQLQGLMRNQGVSL